MMQVLHTTPAAPAAMAIGAVTELSPDEHMTGIFTAREIEYAAANVGEAYKYQHPSKFISYKKEYKAIKPRATLFNLNLQEYLLSMSPAFLNHQCSPNLLPRRPRSLFLRELPTIPIG